MMTHMKSLKVGCLVLSIALSGVLFGNGDLVGDIDGDFSVDWQDIYHLNQQWLDPVGICPEGHDANIDGVGGVDIKDYAALAANFGKVQGFSANKIVEWKMDETSGTAVTDSSGNSNNGATSGEPLRVDGLVGKCLQFDGSNDYVFTNTASNLPLGKTDSWSMNAFLYPTRDITGWSLVAGFGEYSGATLTGRYIYGGSSTVSFHGRWMQSDESWDLNQWQMVTVTYDGKYIKAYKNADLLYFSNPGSLGSEDLSKTKIYLAQQLWSDLRFRGKMDEFTIWDDALSQEEISVLADVLPKEPKKVLEWKFDEVTGTAVEDSTCSGSDGVISGTVARSPAVFYDGLEFDGSAGKASAGNAANLPANAGKKWSMSMYVYCDSVPSGPTVIAGFGNSSGTGQLDKRYLAVTADGKIGFWNGVSVTSIYTDFDIGKWQMITITYDGGVLTKIYKNAVLAGLSFGDYTDTTSEVNIGGEFLAETFEGIVDDFSIWDDELSLTEITQMVRTPYYFDSENGSDSNTGRSPTQAWSSLAKFNATTWQPGDRVLFKGGSQYTGQLKPKGSGVKDRPIVIACYGLGRPRIDGNGLYITAVLLENEQYVHITDLEVTNTNGVRVGGRMGVNVSLSDYGIARGIVLRNLFVHDVYGSLVKGEGLGGNGILWQNGGSAPLAQSYYNGLTIEDCHLLRTDRNGICGLSWPDSYNVAIRDNYLEDIGGDGIVPLGTSGCVVEYNVINKAIARATDAACGMWPFSCDDTIFQYNEVYNCAPGANGDGEAFDCDYACDGTVFQYNYSHDNPKGFMRICTGNPDVDYNRNSVVRYNISVNDGSIDDGVFALWKRLDNTAAATAELTSGGIIFSSLNQAPREDSVLMMVRRMNGAITVSMAISKLALHHTAGAILTACRLILIKLQLTRSWQIQAGLVLDSMALTDTCLTATRLVLERVKLSTLMADMTSGAISFTMGQLILESMKKSR